MRVNENVMVKAGSLESANVTKKEFFDIMIKKALDNKQKDFHERWWDKKFSTFEEYLKEKCSSELFKAFKGEKFYSLGLFEDCLSAITDWCMTGNVTFDYENWGCLELYCQNEDIPTKDFIDDSLYTNGVYGLHTKEGFTYVAFWAGGDWECPVFSVLYLTPEKEFAIYTPLKGNPVVLETMQPFGNEEDDLFDWDDPENEPYEDYADKYIQTTGVEDFRIADCPYTDLCLEDVLLTIKVKKN